MVETYERRPEDAIVREQAYLERMALDIEKELGRTAARTGTPTHITQPLDALDRARELVRDLDRQMRVRTLEEAVKAQLEWLERAEARLDESSGEPKVAFDKIALDRRLLTDILRGWRAQQN